MPKNNKPAIELPEVFHCRWRRALQAKHITQLALCDRLGIRPSRLSSVATGKLKPSKLLCRALELEIGPAVWAWCLDQGPPPPEVAS